METIKDFMVCKDTQPLVMVNKPAMNGLLHITDCQFLFCLGLQDILKSLQLFGTVGKHIYLISLVLVVEE